MNMPAQNYPGIFSGRDINTKCWPRKCLDMLVISGNVEATLKLPQAGLSYRLENFISIALSSHFHQEQSDGHARDHAGSCIMHAQPGIRMLQSDAAGWQ